MRHNKFIQALIALSLAACAGASSTLNAQPPQFEATVLIPINVTEVIFAMALNNKGESIGSWTIGITSVGATDINDRGQILTWTNLGTVLLNPIR